MTFPAELVHQAFVATPLTQQTAVLDYAAYMASPDVIRVHSDGRWPVDGFTLEDDRQQVAQHEADHRAGRSFAFALLNPVRDESLGCLYLNPLQSYLQRAGADDETRARYPADAAMVTFWLRQDRQHTDLATTVVEAVTTWLPGTHLWRCLPAEHASRQALESLNLHPVTLNLVTEKRPYLWFQA
ncbi:GNAT family protein [Actinoplanes sp. Pm04-4]|uniref:GNAT family protein n=1 Tax=Paractinoplanes pyxinae TaxID=2997416 RepID=A0ABT4B0C6_9ACTN|nr:GNAT family protein [Actinoplanes pyxinae]MCY1139916.1 GNAT family protein [Actinoplanes pyxinae]